MAVSLSAVSVVAAGSGQSRAGQGRKIRKYDLHSVDRLEELRHNMNEIVEILCQGSWQGAAGQPRATCRGQGRDFSPSVVSGRAGAGGRDRPLPHTRPSSCQPPGTAQQALWLREEQRWLLAAGEGQGWVQRVRLGCGEIGRSQ